MDRIVSTLGGMAGRFSTRPNIVAGGTVSINGVVVSNGGAFSETGMVVKAQADGGLQATLPDGRVIDVGTAECVLLCGGDVYRATGAVTFTANTVKVSGTGLRLAAPTAQKVEVTGANADVNVGGPCETVVCSGVNSTVRCGDIANLRQSGLNASVYGNRRTKKKTREEEDYDDSD
jgi:hypothetical protein